MTLYASVYEAMPAALFCALTNARNRIRAKKHRIYPTKNKYLYTIIDDRDEHIIICRRNRHNLYKRGIANRIEKLVREYQLELIDCRAGEVMIDCGANIGELGFWARKQNLRYFPVEPEEREVECCNLNIFHGSANFRSRALWKEDGILDLYSKPNEADSSLVEMRDYSTTRKVEAVTLATFIGEYDIDRIKILKIEAEGAEPEILEGAIPVLDRVSYISVDCGLERGVTRDSTFNEVHKILVANNFEIVHADMHRIVVLYKNRGSTAS